ncbi:hypothetical protein [Paenibacillus gallinarum]|uniref:DUF4064 domain-containing protein n=1 Tax=Paenibacillus gallinarum TaxID=2762232 RepID=A0ABR8STW0_9BACL|nr:hypothetical protein [Paenibacillus gallinarum]MBD7966931.1 hypothetical protein [Paenibacillus gallinarum]
MDKIEPVHEMNNTKNEEVIEVNNPYGTFQPPVTPLRHSGPGLTSLILGILSLITYIAILALAPAAAEDILQNPSSEAILESIYVMIIGVLILIGLLLNLIGMILSIIGLTLKNRKKIFPIIGMVIHGIILLVIIGFFSLSLI